MGRKRRKKKNKGPIIIFVILVVIIGLFVARKLNMDNSGTVNLSNINEGDKIVDDIDDDKYENKKITLAATGDIMFHTSQIKGAYDSQTDSYDFKEFFEPIKEIIESADIAIANFEGTTAGSEYPYVGWPRFNAPDEALDAIKYIGFDVLSTANNHIIDRGKIGIVNTIDNIEQRGMDSIGTFKERPQTRILVKDVKGIKIAFLSYTYGCNGLEQLLTEEELNSMVNIIDRDKIAKDISEAKEAEADLIIAVMHWGNEYQRDPSSVQKDLADFMLNKGVNIILGSHPHVIQNFKTLEYGGDNVFVAYSMGNFISNQRLETLEGDYGRQKSQYSEDGVIINFEIEKNGITGKTEIKSVNFIPTWVYRYKKGGKFDYRVYPIMEYVESNEIDKETKSRMQRSYNDTMSKMNIQ